MATSKSVHDSSGPVTGPGREFSLLALEEEESEFQAAIGEFNGVPDEQTSNLRSLSSRPDSGYE